MGQPRARRTLEAATAGSDRRCEMQKPSQSDFVVDSALAPSAAPHLGAARRGGRLMVFDLRARDVAQAAGNSETSPSTHNPHRHHRRLLRQRHLLDDAQGRATMGGP